jgi:hypothetical protein
MQPTFHRGRADVQIVHQSRYLPSVLENLMNRQLRRGGLHRLGRWSVLRERGWRERWLVHEIETGGP